MDMNKKMVIGMCLCLLWVVTAMAQEGALLISTNNTSLLLRAKTGSQLFIDYYGEKIAEKEIPQIYDSRTAYRTPAYPVFGLDCQPETAMQVCHSDGNLSLDLAVSGTEQRHSGNVVTTTVWLKDKAYPFEVKLVYKAHLNTDIIETWAEIVHKEKKPVVMKHFDSGYLPVRKGNVWISHLHGEWASEAVVTTEPLKRGMKVIKNMSGTQNAMIDHSEIMLSLDGEPKENSGRVIGAALCWPGNYRLRVDTRDGRFHHLYAGINPEASEYKLEPGELFVTPQLAFTYSHEGLSGVSRNFHRWGRNEKIHGGNVVRDILLNSWEGVYFKVNEEKMKAMMQDIAALGGELFVMDDGWFAGSMQRNDARSTLGDWFVDKKKLPNGIEGLVNDAQNNKIKFGIWIEPEMTNIESDLYKAHPDWVISQPNRNLRPGRGGGQLILDASNPKVQDFIFGVVDNLMTAYPEIAYIKWDANMSIANYGSHYLPAGKQSHLYIEYHRGIRKVVNRIRDKYPDLVIQACSSGGGRVNYGFMEGFDEFWVSDNTDALQRIYMQWGTSYFYPAIAMASHVSAAKNHQTGRVIPIKFRFDVAMTGRLGLEIQPKDMSESEKQFSGKAIETYKSIREVIQFGDLYRGISPYDNKGVASLMYSTEKKDRAVFFAFKTKHYYAQPIPRFRLPGLDPNKRYVIKELNTNKPLYTGNQEFLGKWLMEQGLELPLPGEYASHVFEVIEKL